MSDIVPADQIERIVGARRHPTRHIARGVISEDRLYILHPEACRARYADLRDCPWSLAMERGVVWLRPDRPTYVNLRDSELIAAGAVSTTYLLKEADDE